MIVLRCFNLLFWLCRLRNTNGLTAVELPRAQGFHECPQLLFNAENQLEHFTGFDPNGSEHTCIQGPRLLNSVTNRKRLHECSEFNHFKKARVDCEWKGIEFTVHIFTKCFSTFSVLSSHLIWVEITTLEELNILFCYKSHACVFQFAVLYFSRLCTMSHNAIKKDFSLILEWSRLVFFLLLCVHVFLVFVWVCFWCFGFQSKNMLEVNLSYKIVHYSICI